MTQTAGECGVAAEIFARHRKSQQPESQQICAVLGAVLEVVKAEGMEASPTALFAALMSSLENSATRSSPEVCTAVASILGLVLARTPTSVVRSKFQASSSLICDSMDEHMDKAPPLRALLKCLSQLLAGADPTSWGPTTTRPWGSLVHLTTDPRPKVRKVAAGGLVDVLAAIQNTPALSQASVALQKACANVFKAPEEAARAAAAASNKKRAEAEAVITEAVSEALHMMGALRIALPLASSQAAAAVAQQLLGLYPLRQPLLTRHATVVITALAEAPTSHLPPAALAELLKVVLSREDAWASKDVDALVSLSSFVSSAICRLHAAGDKSTAGLLPQAMHSLVQQLGAEQDGVRFGAVGALRMVLEGCVDSKLLGEKPAANGKPTCAQSVVAALAGALSPQYQSSWSSALPLVGGLFKQLGPEHAPLVSGLLERLGALLSGAAQGVEEGDLDAVECQPAVEAALGAALVTLGPRAVLSVLPLQLKEGLDGTAEARTWMLPLMRRHIRGASLGLWAKELLPLARAMGSHAATMLKSGAKGSAARAAACRTLEMQIWHTLPAFANSAHDVAEAFPAMARDMGTAFQNRSDLRSPICLAVGRLCRQTRELASEAGVLEAAGVLGAGPVAFQGVAESAALEGETGSPDGQRSAGEVKKDLEALQRFAPNFLSLLLNTYVESEAEARTEVGTAISCYASITAAPVLANVFRTIIQKLIKVTQDDSAELPAPDMITEGGDTPTARRCTFMDLSLAVASGLDSTGINTLYKAAVPVLKDRESALQKKAYKLLAYICEEHPDFTRQHAQEILDHLVSGLPSAHSAVKRHRLRSVKAMVLMLDGPEAPEVSLTLKDGEEEDDDVKTPEGRRKQVVASLISEIVMCTKESNKKTRAAAYDLLVEIGKTMDSNRGAAVRLGAPMDEGGEESGLQSLFTMVMAGLVASHPHMISASVTALARLVFEFSNRLTEDLPELLRAVTMLFRTKSREVVKACLGFVKVVVMRLSAWQLEPHIKDILEGILVWAHDSKNRFKLKVRTILEALAKRCGYDAVASNIPESDAKLLVHIRKTKERMQRQKKAKAKAAGSVVDGEEGGDVDMDARSRATSAVSSRARTARASEWGHTAIFSDLMDEEDEDGAGASRRSAKAAAKGRGGRLRDAGDEPMDLLGKGASRDLMRASNARKVDRTGDGFQRAEDGRLVIAEEEDGRRGSNKRGRGDDTDDESDGDDSLGALTQAVKSGAGRAVKFANSAGGGGSVAGRTAGKSSMVSKKSRASMGSNKEHSGDRFKPSKKGTGGDVKGKTNKVEPYAYWPLDKKMLNRRGAKRQVAKKGLDRVVKAAKAGAAQGRKAAKRART